MAYSQDSLASELLFHVFFSLKKDIYVEAVLMEIGNLMWPDGGSTQAYIHYDDCGDLICKMTEQAGSQVGGLEYGTLPCITLSFLLVALMPQTRRHKVKSET